MIGNTPLLRIRMFEREFPRVEVYAKAEWFNPGGSVKDRAALSMIEDGERRGALTFDKTIIDSTSGNTGIAYAMVAAAKGYRVKLVMPANVSAERKALISAYGAEAVFSDAGEGSDGAIRLVRELVAAEPDRYFYPDQYSNPANARAHYEGTAVEILEQTGGSVTHFIAGLGTTGTFVGTSRRLKEHDPVDPHHRGAARGFVPRAGRPEAHPDRDRAEDLGSEPRRRDLGLPHRARLRPGARRGPHRGAASRPLERRRALGGEAPGRDDRRGRRRHGLPGLGRSLPLDRPLRPEVKISPAALKAVRAHVAEGYPNEICGMLVAPKGSRDVTEIRRATNANTERPRDTYQIDPREHRAIEKECDRAGLDIVGYYHSHPDHASYASIRDTEQAWPDYFYLIFSCIGGEVKEGKVFSRSDWETRQMVEEPLEVLPGADPV